MPALAEVASEKLQALASAGRARALVTSRRNGLLSFNCNDYLGLSQHPKVKEAGAAAMKNYGAGAGASRLVSGNHPLYAELEEKLAVWKETEAALVFGSGYLANIGVIPALVGKGDVVLADRLVHASMLDGIRLSGAKLLRFAHNDADNCAHLLAGCRAEHRHALILTEEVFSMDGDLAPLAALRDIATAQDAWLMVDGAHSLAACRSPADIYVGTLSKALGAYGGFVCAQKDVIAWLLTAARSFLFSTGLPPATIASASAALTIMMEDAAFVSSPLIKARRFTAALGLPLAQSPIVPLVLGSESRAVAASRALEAEGYLVAAIRPPTVPEGTSRLRFTFSALHEDADIDQLAAFIQAQGWVTKGNVK